MPTAKKIKLASGADPSKTGTVPTEESSNPDASSSKPTDLAQSTVGADITAQFGPENSGKSETSAATKGQFLTASLVVPGIALKKFKMAMAADAANATNFVAVFGEATVKMHRAVRPTLEGMIIGNLTRHQQTFWASAAKHLKTKGISAILQPSGSATSIEAASWQRDLRESK